MNTAFYYKKWTSIKIRCKTSLKYLRFREFDVSTETGRSDERHRRIALSAFSGAISQGVNGVVMIITVPLLLKFMGKEQYGLWLAISAAGSFAAFSDLGMGNGLVNLLGRAHGLEDRGMARAYVSSATAALCSMAVLVAVSGGFLLAKVDWAAFFHVQESATASATRFAVGIYFGSFLLNLVFGVSGKVRMAFQEMYVNNLLMAATRVLMFVGVLIGAWCGSSFLYFVTVLAGAQCATAILNSLFLFGRTHPWLRPTVRAVDFSAWKKLFGSGWYFLVGGVGTALAIQIDTVVIGRYLGADQVPAYAIPLRLFQIATGCLGFVLVPLWPAFREALVRGDVHWVKRTFRRAFFLTYVTMAASSFVLLFISPWLLKVWTQGQIEAGFALRVTLCIYAVVGTVGPMAMLLNGANMIKQQAFFALISGVVNLSLSVFLVKRIGLIGPLWGTILAQLIFGWGVSFYYISKLFKRPTVL